MAITYTITGVGPTKHELIGAGAGTDLIGTPALPTRLASGDYTLENGGGAVLYLAERDAVVADLDTIVGGHTVEPGESGRLKVESSNLVYVWTNRNPTSIILTEAR